MSEGPTIYCNLTDDELFRLADERWDDPLVCELVKRLEIMPASGPSPTTLDEAKRRYEARYGSPDHSASVASVGVARAAANEPKPSRRKRERSEVSHVTVHRTDDPAEMARLIRSEQVEGRLVGAAFHAHMRNIAEARGPEFCTAVWVEIGKLSPPPLSAMH